MRIIGVFIILSLMGCQIKERNLSKNFTFPPEWKPHQAVWIDFNAQEYWIEKDHLVKIEIINALHLHVPGI